jgi:hypothetical protein
MLGQQKPAPYGAGKIETYLLKNQYVPSINPYQPMKHHLGQSGS